jgi:tripartite-type tricarboxylate transporter receptor subunit TctC
MFKHTRKWLALAALTFGASSALAQDFPSRPVKILVPQTPGGASDALARIIAQKLTEKWGQPVVVVNKSLPVHNVPELIDYAKANPGTVTYGSAGNGSSNHFGGFNFARLAGIEATHVPYRGSAPALVDVMAGKPTFMFDAMVTSMPQVRGGKLRALATSGTVRSKQIPDLPTVAETVPGLANVGWFAIFGPAELPAEIAQRLSLEIAKLAQTPEFINNLSKQGFEVVVSTPEQLRERMAKESQLLEPIVKTSGVKVRFFATS